MMNKNRKIAIVTKKSTFEEADNDYLFFWADKSVNELFKELQRLRKNFWTWKLGTYPVKIEKVVTKRSLYAGE